MAAFGLSPRVLTDKLPFNIDPGAYQNSALRPCPFRKSCVPFNSTSKRVTGPINKGTLDVIYNVKDLRNIPTATTFRSKVPRFPYESFSKDDLDRLLCYCGLDVPCDCDDKKLAEQELLDIDKLCQAKQRRKLIVGSAFATPKITITHDKPDPPFYNVAVHESTKFYHGCKWSQHTAKRASKSSEVCPGPADYDLERKPTPNDICLELTRHDRRKNSKQPRYIEMIQKRTIIDNQPSPATYHIKEPRLSGNRFLKADRFSNKKLDECAGPADHWIRRLADPPPPLERFTLATLPERACFGVKAARFKTQRVEGPGPATYDPKFIKCYSTHCPTAGFGSSAKRFQDPPPEEFESDDEEPLPETEVAAKPKCPKLTWSFKSRTKRLKDLVKKWNEPSPADFLPPPSVWKRSCKLQYLAPFWSSEGRFVPWYDWMSVIGSTKTPGPGQYCLEKKGCPTAVPHGPLSRDKRFKTIYNENPPPGAYNLEKQSEVLNTFNKRLKENIGKRPQYKWKSPEPQREYSLQDLEAHLLEKTIALLDDEVDSPPAPAKTVESVKSKMLKCFL